MKPALILACALALAAAPAVAKDKNGKPGKSHQRNAAAFCPPGLAKKRPACVPPGQAKKLRLRRGDRYDGSGRVLRDYGRYGLPRLDRGESYYRLGDTVIAVDEDTRRVLDIVGVLSRAAD